MSIEVDVAFLHEDPAIPKWAEVDGAIGELSLFHQTFSYYAQGIEVTSASLPDGWRDRLVAFQPEDAEPARAVCLDKHDLVIAKLVAHREKDLAFAVALLDAGLLDTSILHERAAALSSVPPPTRRRVQRWLTAAINAGGASSDRAAGTVPALPPVRPGDPSDEYQIETLTAIVLAEYYRERHFIQQSCL